MFFVRSVLTCGAAVIGLSVCAGGAFAQARIIAMGVEPGGAYGDALAVSDDGRVVMGFTRVPSPGSGFQYRWTDAGGRELIAFDTGFSVAVGMSCDGRTLLGWGGVNGVAVNYVWRDGVMQELPGGDGFGVSCLSADGSTVGGTVIERFPDGTFNGRPARWTAGTGIVEMPMAEAYRASVNALSGDGAVACGLLDYVGSHAAGVRWVGGGVTGVPETFDALHTEVLDLTRDGTVGVGFAWDGGIRRPYAWTFSANGGVLAQVLAQSPGWKTRATRISGDGSVITGVATDHNFSSFPVIWRQGQPVRRLADDLVLRGVDVSGWILLEVFGLSGDGAFLVGEGVFEGKTQGFLVRTRPACGTADFDGDGDTATDADIEAFFACIAGQCCAACLPGGADFDGDGDTATDADIEAFFRVLGGGAC